MIVHSTRSTLPLLLAAALVAASCEDLATVPVGAAPTVSSLASDVVAGHAVPLRIQNPTEVSWTYATCPGAFQRYVDGAWVDVPPAVVACTLIITVVSPGETVDVGAFLSSEAPAGTYRALVPFGKDGQVVQRVSNTFTVAALPIGDAPTVSVLDAIAARGTDVTVRLVNPTAIAFLYNLCGSARLERLVAGAWTPTAEPLWLCTAAMYPLAAGQFVDEPYPILGDLVPGTYRLRVPLYRAEPDTDAITRYSNSFTVN